MKKLLKGFTLIELIVVMAILSILVTGIMQMFKPIREIYIDSTLTESRRNTQTGVVTYIAESLRFATDVGIYNSVSDVTNAVDAFANGYADKAGYHGDSDVIKLIKENVQIIVIDNEKDYEYGGRDDLRGRLLRRNADSLGNASAIGLSDSNYRMAMGAAYYGGNKYSVTLTADEADPSAGIGITVASSARYGLARELKDETVKTNGHVVCRNLEAPISGFYDVDIPAGGMTSAGRNTYIVFFNERPDGLPDA